MNTKRNALYLALIASGATPAIVSAQSEEGQASPEIEEVMVFGSSRVFSSNEATGQMLDHVSDVSNVMGAIDQLPGVLVNEGDAFGGDDWSTNISVRGFSISLDEQQLGMTIDGIPNGNSNYGGGSKANRFIDTPNMAGVELIQGASDVSSWSNEALGGSMDFRTRDPSTESAFTTSFTAGDFDTRKLFARYDTGEIFPNTYAWLSLSTQESDVWMDETAGGNSRNSGGSERDHAAFKFKGFYGPVELTGYYSRDEVHENNYQRVTPAQFDANPEWDRLTGEWTGIPHIDQLFRPGWGTIRENDLAYLKTRFNVSGVDFNTSVYYHENTGRGDWLPPFMPDLRDEGEGQPESELSTDPEDMFLGLDSIGIITFVDRNGIALDPIPGCQSSLDFPFGGAGPEFDPECQPDGAIPVGSYRHTHYYKQRTGITADASRNAQFGAVDNTLSAGFWYEDYTREESRDFHKVIDSRVGMAFEDTPFWQQYDRRFPQDTFSFFVHNTLDTGPVTLELGAKKHTLDLERIDKQLGERTVAIDSDSDVNFSGGLVYRTPIEGLEVFGGFAETFSSIKDSVLEARQTELQFVEPETADSLDLGLRYVSRSINASLTYYDIEFSNRITFLPEDTVDGIDFVGEIDGAFVNVGGIDTSGVEAALEWRIAPRFEVFFSYTNNDSVNTGTDDPLADELLGVFPGNTVFGSHPRNGARKTGPSD